MEKKDAKVPIPAHLVNVRMQILAKIREMKSEDYMLTFIQERSSFDPKQPLSFIVYQLWVTHRITLS